jgi:hypothetical protein
MKLFIAALLGLVVLLVLGAGSILIYGVSVSNAEIGLRNLINAKQRDNKAEFDNMKHKIGEVATVSEFQFEKLKEIFTEYAKARTSGGEHALASWVKESVPNVDTKTFENLQNIIVSSRDSWTQRQKELLDQGRQHTDLLTKFPSSLILSGILGRQPIEITIVTSTATEKAFQTGKDDDTLKMGTK